MRSSTTKRASHKAHQTVTEDFIELSTGSESIRIGFTEQKISGRAGISTFCGFLGWHRFGELLAKLLPPREAKAAGGRGGRPAQPAHEIALGFIAGILSGAQRLTHVGWLRADPMLRRLLGSSRSPVSRRSPVFSRFSGIRGSINAPSPRSGIGP